MAILPTEQKMQETADLVTFTEETLNEKLHFLYSDHSLLYLFNSLTPDVH